MRTTATGGHGMYALTIVGRVLKTVLSSSTHLSAIARVILVMESIIYVDTAADVEKGIKYKTFLI